MLLDVKGISYRVSQEWCLLNEISLAVAPGEFVGLFGENGCGKTTLLQIIAGALRGSSGRILIREGQNSSDTAVHTWPMWKRCRAGLVYVPQENRIWPELLVCEHIELALSSDLSERGSAVSRQDILDVLPSDKRVGELSHGQQRYLLLMRALMMAPRVLLADEPLAGLDKELQQVATSKIKDMMALGMCGIVVEHDREALAALGARLLKLEEGALHAV